jgi:hypothetical protein
MVMNPKTDLALGKTSAFLTNFVRKKGTEQNKEY